VSRNGARSVKAVKGWGLLANGSSGRWSIDIDESDDGGTFNMQIDGPLAYLAFALRDLQVVPKLLAYLRGGLHPDQGNGKRSTTGVTLGRLGSMAVSIIQDDEFATRWFIIIKGKADAIVRLTLDAADAEMLVDALGQVMEDLPEID
jgi:hypothetical protein